MKLLTALILVSSLAHAQAPEKKSLAVVLKERAQQMAQLKHKKISAPRDGVQEKSVQLSNLKMHYLEAGTGPVLVLLHGWPQHSHMWRRVMGELSKNYRVIAPDQRGAGKTTILDTGYDKATMAQDLKEFLDKLEIQTLHLAGYDLGGGVAYAFAAANPAMVTKLMIMEFALAGFGLEGSLQFDKTVNANSNWHMAMFQVLDISEHFFGDQKRDMLAWFFWHISCDPLAVTPENFKIYLDAISQPKAFKAGLLYYATLFQDLEANRASAQKKLTMPVLGVGGECSGGPYIEKLLAPVATNVKGAVIPKAGHWLADENPAELAKVMLEFLSAR